MLWSHRWDEIASWDLSGHDSKVWNWNPQSNLILSPLTHSFPVMKCQWEWKHPGLANSSGQCGKLMGENFIISGSWGIGLVGNNFAKFLSVLQVQPIPVPISWIPFLYPALLAPLGVIPPHFICRISLFAHSFLNIHACVLHTLLQQRPCRTSAPCRLPGGRCTMGNKQPCSYKS